VLRVVAGSALGIVLLVGLGGGEAFGAGASSWPQLGFNAAHTGFNPDETTLSRATVPHVTQTWIHNTNVMRNDSPSVPVVADGKVFEVDGDGNLVALDASTGLQLWKFSSPSSIPRYFTTPIVANGLVYTFKANSGGPTPPGTLYTLNDATGAVVRTSPMLETSALVYSDGVLYTDPIGNAPVAAYDAATGALLWSTSLGPFAGDFGFTPPAVADGEVFLTNSDSTATRILYALNATTGQVIWSRAIGVGRTEGVSMSPVVAGHTVIIATRDSHMWALNTATGGVRWQKTLLSIGVAESAPAVYGGRIFQALDCDNGSGTERKCIQARTLSTGARVWSHVYENYPLNVVSSDFVPRSPTIANGLVWLPEMNAQKIRVFTTGGRLVAVIPTGEFVMTTVIVADGQAFISTWDPAPTGGGFVQAFGL
jgi:outer membrane protein assembly factor BamB